MKKFINVFLFSPLNSFLIFLITILAGFTGSLLALSLFPLMREINAKIDENNFILKYYDLILSFFNIGNSITVVLTFMVSIVLVGSIINIIFDLYSNYVFSKIGSDLRIKLFNKILITKWLYFVEKKPGEILNSIILETQKTAGLYRGILECLSFFIQFIFYASVSIVISTQISLITISIGLIIVLIFLSWNTKAKKSGKAYNLANQNLTTKILDTVRNIKTIKASGKSNFLSKFFFKDFLNLQNSEYKMNSVLVYPKRLIEPLIVFFLAIGVYIIFKYELLNLGELIPIIFLFMRTIERLTGVQRKYHYVKKMEPFYDSYNLNLKKIENLKESFDGKLIPSKFKKLEFVNLNFTYNKKIIFKNANLIINSGTINVIHGLSGIGKTTLLDLICQILELESGNFLIDGTNIKRYNIEEWRKKIGYVTQDDTFYNDTLKNNICFGDTEISQESIDEALKISCSEDFIKKLDNGINTNIGEAGSKLSGGQKQRISIARALLKKPLLLILDEATNALDQNNKIKIIENLKKEAKQGLTIILTSHDKEILSFANNIIEIKDSKINIINSS